MAPVKTFQTSTKYCPWLSEDTKKIIIERNEAQKIVSESKTDENFEKYKTLRNKVTKNIKNDKLQWQRKKLDACNNDPGKLWKNVLGWLNWSSSGSPSKLYHNGQILKSPSKLTNIMNDFFISKVSTIRRNLPDTNEDPLKTKILLRIETQISLSLVFIQMR